MVELTIALHRVFDSPKDAIIWDVSHQCYTHKILTGRYNQLSTLRKKDGISGVCIAYCPWCGQKLPASKRERWFEELDGMGIDYSLFDTERVPEPYLSDAWWKQSSND